MRSLRGAARCGLYPVGALRFPPATFSRASGANEDRYSTENSEVPSGNMDSGAVSTAYLSAGRKNG